MINNITSAVTACIHELYGIDIQPVITRPDAEFGDFATNVAMQLAPVLNKNPRDIATAIAEVVRRDNSVMSAEVAGPGFINIRLTDSEIIQSLGIYQRSTKYRGQIVVIETNNPNPFKDLHIGHAYNAIIADTIANLLEAGSAQVHRVSYHGNVGLHVGKSMWAILNWCQRDEHKLDEVAVEDRSKFMSERYVEGAIAYDTDAGAKEAIEQLAKESFAPTDEVYKSVYERCIQWSFEYITEIVARLGSKPVEKRYLESEADSIGVATVRANIGEVFSESEGAVVFAGEAFGLHTRVFIASRGTGLYEARDLGLMQLKQADFHPAKSYIITAEEQKQYFRVVIKAAELALPDLNGVTQNISTGTVKLSTGKMSSRTGDVLNIEWLFDQLKTALADRGGEVTDSQTLIGALRYAMLKVRVGSDVVFDIESSISLEGNSGPYLQYAHARACSILKKSSKTAVTEDGTVLDEWERRLALKVSEYEEVVELAVRELLPHYITTYLYELAHEFNRFYEHSRIIDDSREEIRLTLVKAYVKRLAEGLGILGIPAPDHL